MRLLKRQHKIFLKSLFANKKFFNFFDPHDDQLNIFPNQLSDLVMYYIKTYIQSTGITPNLMQEGITSTPIYLTRGSTRMFT